MSKTMKHEDRVQTARTQDPGTGQLLLRTEKKQFWWYLNEESIAFCCADFTCRPKLAAGVDPTKAEKIPYWEWKRLVFSFRKGRFQIYHIDQPTWREMSRKGWQRTPRVIKNWNREVARQVNTFLKPEVASEESPVGYGQLKEELAKRAKAAGLYCPEVEDPNQLLTCLTYPSLTGAIQKGLFCYDIIPGWFAKGVRRTSIRDCCKKLFGVAGKKIIQGFEQALLDDPSQLASPQVLLAHCLRGLVPTESLQEILNWRREVAHNPYLVEQFNSEHPKLRDYFQTLALFYGSQRLMVFAEQLFRGAQGEWEEFRDLVPLLPCPLWFFQGTVAEYGFATVTLEGHTTWTEVRRYMRRIYGVEVTQDQVVYGVRPGCFVADLPTRPRTIHELHDELVRQKNIWDRDNLAKQLAAADLRTRREACFHYIETVQALDGQQVGRFTLRLPHTTMDLSFWGRSLNICIGVYGYDAHYGRQLLLGLFAEDAETPTYCLAVSMAHNLLQFKGARNNRATPEDYVPVVQDLLRLGVLRDHYCHDEPQGVEEHPWAWSAQALLWKDCPTTNHFSMEEVMDERKEEDDPVDPWGWREVDRQL